MEQTEQQEMSTIRWFGEDQSNATSLTSMANIITVSTETSFADYQNSTATSSRTIVEDYQPLLSPLIDDKSIDLSSISHTDSEDIEMRCPLLSDFPDNRSNFSERRATISVVRQSADDTGRLVTNWAKRSVVADVLSNDVPPCSASMHEQGRRMIHCLIQNVRSNCLPYHGTTAGLFYLFEMLVSKGWLFFRSCTGHARYRFFESHPEQFSLRRKRQHQCYRRRYLLRLQRTDEAHLLLSEKRRVELVR